MALKVHYNYIDHSAERTRTQLYFADVASDGSNYGDLFDAVTGSVDILRIALDVITKLNETNVLASIEAHIAAGTLPSDATAQRETAIRFVYIDNVTNKRYRFDVPAPADAFVPTGSDEVNMAAAVVITFKGIFEAQCVSPVGNPVTLISGRFVGRRD